MKKKIQAGLIVIAFVFGFFASGISGQAESTTSSNETGGYYYRLEKPENQIDKNTSYFDLRMKPGQQQTVHIEFTNTSDEDYVFTIELNGAKTNQNGVIEYGPTTLENDASLKHAFEDIVTGAKELKVPAGETVPLKLDISMPEDEFDGVIAGGIWFQVQTEDDPEATGVTHKTAYVVGMLLSEKDAAVEADLQLNDVYAQLNNYRGAIYVDFSNVNAAFLGSITVDTSIAAKDKPDEILYESKTSGMEMAPNSFMTYPISLNGDPYRAGSYIADIVVTSGDKEWKWTQEFEITQRKAEELNEQDVSIVQEKGFDWWLIGGIAAGVIALIAAVYFILHFRNKKKKDAENRKRRRKTGGINIQKY